MRIGILTYHRAKNYGAFLQSFALCSRLNQEKDMEAEIIDFHMDKEIEVYKLNSSLKHIIAHPANYLFMNNLYDSFTEALRLQKLSNAYLHSNKITDFIKFVDYKYDVIIAGSDEIWKINGVRGFPTPYWLPGNLHCKKVSYAASSCTNYYELNTNVSRKIKELLTDFSLISVRDQITYDQISQIMGDTNKIILSPDPTFIYSWNISKDKGKQIFSNNCRINKKKKIALVMTEDMVIAQKIRKHFSKKYNLVSVFHPHKGYINIAHLNPFDWINAIAASDFVFTSYFHATCFSIIANVPFMAVGTKNKINKIKDILNRSGNNYRYLELSNNEINEENLISIYKNCEKEINNKFFIDKCQSEFMNYLTLLRHV